MVRRVFDLMYKEIRGLHQAAYILALFAIGSQLLAIVRDRLLAHIFGAGPELDIYYAAFRIPDLLYVLFASILSVYVLLPFVNRAEEKNGIAAGVAVISQVFSLFLIGFSVVAGVLAITAPWYVPYIFPGLATEAGTLTVLLQILLLQAFFLGLSSLCGVVTQIGHRFVLYAISPLFYNLGIIIGITVFYQFFGLAGLALGVVIGALGHLAIQIPFVVTSQYRFTWQHKIEWKLIKEILVVAIPRGLTLSVNQLVLLLLIGIATTMAAGSVSVFQFAFNLQSVPLAVIGMSYSVAAFPTLSRMLAKGKTKEFNLHLLTALRHIIFWSIPIMVLIVVLRAQIVRVLLGSGAFDWADTRLTAAVLAVFVISLFAQAILLLLFRAFYAGGRTLVPFLVASISSGLAIITAFLLVDFYVTQPAWQIALRDMFRLQDVIGAEVLILAFAFTVSQLLQLVMLVFLSRKTFGISYRPLYKLTLKAILASMVGGIIAYASLTFVVDGINQNTFIGISLQGLVAGVAGIVGSALTYYVLRAPELQEIYYSFKSKILKTDVIAPEPERL